ncbi:hypothetical protein PoB_007703600 [Plakobranchus ocellatus]|uniref:Uncharacterized protein n=1 Tax=Plakobranchus ocellatus TaxID=259542 RepID=A0AAV4E404_9GAST|nr:hypothetical protein PoB_007703600 [Plakobranchus ocellatus]
MICHLDDNSSHITTNHQQHQQQQQGLKTREEVTATPKPLIGAGSGESTINIPRNLAHFHSLKLLPFSTCAGDSQMAFGKEEEKKRIHHYLEHHHLHP